MSLRPAETKTEMPRNGAQATGSSQRARFLGLAFAGADLAFEIDARGVIGFALGAVEQVAGAPHPEVAGRHWSTLVEPEDAELLTSLTQGLLPGERRGPLQITLRRRTTAALKRMAMLSVFNLPENEGRLSCAVSVGAPARFAVRRDDSGFIAPDALSDCSEAAIEQASGAGQEISVALVQLQGLQASLARQAPDVAGAVRRRIAATLRMESFGGLGGSEIAENRFAVMQPARAGGTGALMRRLQEVCGQDVTPIGAEIGLTGENPAQNLRAMRYALDRFIEMEPGAVAAGFDDMLARTAAETSRLRTTLARNDFRLVYQPVVTLADSGLHHFEALARLDGDESPARAVQLAEEVGIITDFDIAIAKMAAGALLRADSGVKIAINISAISLMEPQAVGALTNLLADHPDLRRRLLIEITETQRLKDLDTANRLLEQLRRLGHPICIDDFGAGAATLDYLGRLEVDFVKLDGRYVQELARRPRDATIVQHVSRLCRDLGVTTIAEMVESAAVATTLQSLGVQLAQGWHFGKPTAEPIWPAPAPAPRSALRRRGAVEQWS